MNDHNRTTLVAVSSDSGLPQKQSMGFGYFENATLFNKTRLFIIVTLKGKIIRNRDGILSQR